MPRTAICAGPCGQRIQLGRGSLPEGQAKCNACRRLSPPPRKPRDRRRQGDTRKCARDGCAEMFAPWTSEHRFCSRSCGQLARYPDRPERAAWRKRRDLTMQQIPGLTMREQRQLLHRWIAQGRSCTYCPAACESVDHVIPISRGGTNYEGNLAPACRRCNSRKQNRTVMEWLLGRPAPRPYGPVFMVLRAEKKPKAIKPEPVPHECDLPGCAERTTRKRFCSQACSTEWFARAARDAYRAKAGLPVDPTKPTTPRRPRPGLLIPEHAA